VRDSCCGQYTIAAGQAWLHDALRKISKGARGDVEDELLPHRGERGRDRGGFGGLLFFLIRNDGCKETKVFGFGLNFGIINLGEPGEIHSC
jgi:hypothetical protein